MKLITVNLKRTLVLSIISISMLIGLIGDKIAFAAQSDNELDGIITLDNDKVYEYDLNGDGKTEKIQYKFTANDETYTVALELYINDKLCMTREDHGFSYTLLLCDLDKKDNYLDLYGYATMESDCMSYSFFAKYDENNQFTDIKFSPNKLTKHFNTIRYSFATIDGNGKFKLLIDTPIFSKTIGCYYCYVPFQLKNNVISGVSAKSYAFNKFSKTYKYKAKKNFSVYDKVGSNKVAYTVKKGDKVTFDTLYVTKSGKAYYRIANSKKKTGWIKPEQVDLFVEYPAWG